LIRDVQAFDQGKPLVVPTSDPESIAERTGMGSAANLRHHFRAHVRTTSSRYRQTFRA